MSSSLDNIKTLLDRSLEVNAGFDFGCVAVIDVPALEAVHRGSGVESIEDDARRDVEEKGSVGYCT